MTLPGRPQRWRGAAHGRRGLAAVAAAAALAAGGVAVARALPQDEYHMTLWTCPPCLAVVNPYIRADADPRGMWAEGTTGGDPGTPLDNDKRLLYGFSKSGHSLVGTGFATVRVQAQGGITNFISAGNVPQRGLSAAGWCPPYCAGSCPPECEAVESTWRIPVPGAPAESAVLVTETLHAAFNPFSGRDDVIIAEYLLRNHGAEDVLAGLRTLLDVRVGDNDGAPYIIPGVGNVATETVFSGDGVPAFWLAFESPSYDPSLLRALGIMGWEGLTAPDRFVIAKWATIHDTRWDYAVDVNESVTNDSAVALYWDPVRLAPGQSRHIATAYGVAGDRGGGAFLSSAVAVGCDRFSVAFFVSNFGLDPLTQGTATINPPPGLTLATGELAAKPIGRLDPGQTASVVWQLEPSPGQVGPVKLQAVADFAGGERLAAEADLQVTCPAPPTPTPTASATPSPTATRTATATVPPTATRTPAPTPTTDPNALTLCAIVAGRAPAAAVAAALAQPERVAGYNDLCNPNRPADPFNKPRRALSLRNPSAPYHPLQNPLVFKCGCP